MCSETTCVFELRLFFEVALLVTEQLLKVPDRVSKRPTLSKWDNFVRVLSPEALVLYADGHVTSLSRAPSSLEFVC